MDATKRIMNLIHLLNSAYATSTGQGYGVKNCHWYTHEERGERIERALEEAQAIRRDRTIYTYPYIQFLIHTMEELEREKAKVGDAYIRGLIGREKARTKRANQS